MKTTCLFLALLTFPAFAGSAKEPLLASGDWEWSVSVGPSYRNVGSIKANLGYRSHSVPLPTFVGTDSLTVPAIGTESTYADRFYNDGYVRQDPGTSIDGSTWFWGYDNAAQIQGGQLVYSATGAQSIRRETTPTSSLGSSYRNTLQGFAPHIQIDGRSRQEIAGFRIGISAAFDFTRMDQSYAFSNYSVSQFRDDYRLDYVDRYDLNGVIPPLAPYSGSFGGPGPLIGNLPTQRQVSSVLLGTDTAIISNHVRSTIDIDVSSLTLGPTLSRSFGPVDTSFQAGMILNVFHWRGRQSETLVATNAAGATTVASWYEGRSGTKLRPGCFIQAEASYRMNQDWSLATWLRLDTAREFRATTGPSVFRVDPSGFTTGLMVRYELP